MDKYLIGKIWFVTLGLLLFNSAFSQVRCGSDEKLLEYIDSHPEYRQTQALIEGQIQEWINSGQRTGQVITIPVVVHVVYKTAVQNISDAQIISQIVALNKDFRRLNSDASNTPSYFQGLAADMEIQFGLAATDPDGNWTSGITRTETATDSWFASDLVKSSDNGGKDGWDATKYMNIWVCNIGGGYLGVTYPPGVSPNIDGIIIGYKYFGTVGNVQAPYHKGRTLTHEVGHWLNLEHLWGVGENNNNCSADDNISDTPKQSGPNYDCPSGTHVSCNNGPNGDMFMNYMDYTDDACMNLFTEKQKQRMLAVLNGIRSSIKNSDVGTNAVGIEPINEVSDLVEIYPNPASDNIYVDNKSASFGTASYRLINGIGAVVQSGNLNSGATFINVGKLSPGIYFLDLNVDNEKVLKKVIISR